MKIVQISLAVALLAPAVASADRPIGLQPSSAWAISGSGVGPPCSAPVSPSESNWAESAGDGVTLSVIATNIQCCDCIRRSATFATGTTTIAGTHLKGTFNAQNVGSFADGTFRVILYDGTNELGHTVFASQQRMNNNCAGISEEPETIIPSGSAMFNVDLSTVNKQVNMTFDSMVIEILGYACPDGNNNNTAATSALSDVQLVMTGGATTRVGPAATPGVTAPWSTSPDVDGGPAGSIATGDAGTTGGDSGGCDMTHTASTSIALGMLVLAALMMLTRRARA